MARWSAALVLILLVGSAVSPASEASDPPNPAPGTVTTVAGSEQLERDAREIATSPWGLVVAGRTLYWDRAARVHRLDLDTGVVDVALGNGASYRGEGGLPGQHSPFYGGSIALDGQGRLVGANSYGVRRVEWDGTVKWLAQDPPRTDPPAPEDPWDSHPVQPDHLLIDPGPGWGTVVTDSGRNAVYQLVDGSYKRIAGTGDREGRISSGDGGPATEAALQFPQGLAVDPGEGTLLITDYWDGRVRGVDPENGTISTVVGLTLELKALTASERLAALGLPVDTVIPPGLDPSDVRLPSPGARIPALLLPLQGPTDVAFDRDGALLVLEDAHPWGRIWRVVDGWAELVALGGEWDERDRAYTHLWPYPRAITVADDGTWYVSDPTAARVVAVAPDPPVRTVRTVVGSGERCTGGDGGPMERAQLCSAWSAARAPDGAVIVGEGNRLRRFGSDGSVSTLLSDDDMPQPVLIDVEDLPVGVDISDLPSLGVPTGVVAEGRVPAGLLRWLSVAGVDVAEDGDVIFTSNGRVLRFDGETGDILWVAGQEHQGIPESTENDGQPALTATLVSPSRVEVAADGDILVREHTGKIRRIDADTGLLGTVADFGEGAHIDAIKAGPDGSVYAGVDGRIMRVAPGGERTQVLPARWDPAAGLWPRVGGIDIDDAGTLWISRTLDGTLYRLRDGVVERVVGRPHSFYRGFEAPRDGPGLDAQLLEPAAVVLLDDGDLIVTHGEEGVLRRVHDVANAPGVVVHPRGTEPGSPPPTATPSPSAAPSPAATPSPSAAPSPTAPSSPSASPSPSPEVVPEAGTDPGAPSPWASGSPTPQPSPSQEPGPPAPSPPGPVPTAPPSQGGEERGVRRLAGADRVLTAITLSRDAYAAGTAGAVVVARADAFADALAGAPLAAARGGPLLLTWPGALPADVAAEIQRVLAPGGEILVLGGSAAVSAPVVAELAVLAPTRRLAGADRFSTAVAVAEVVEQPGRAYLATGNAFPDALSASAAAAREGAVVLLSADEEIPPATASWFAAHPDVPVTAVGGPAGRSGVTQDIVAGDDRFATAAALAGRSTGTVAALAAGGDFPDALAGAAHAATSQAVLLLNGRDTLEPATREALMAARPNSVLLYGGTAVLGSAVERELAALLGAEGPARASDRAASKSGGRRGSMS